MMYYLLYIIFLPLSILPFPLLFLLSRVLFFMLYHLAGYRKKVVLNNLHNAFPNYAKKDIELIAKNFYLHFSELMLETIKGLSISPKNLQRRYRPKNPKLFRDLYAKHDSILLVQGHYCNWEWFSIIPTYTPHMVFAAYKPVNNLSFDRFFYTLRSRFGVKPIPMQQTARTIIKNKNNKCIHVLIADQSPMKSESRYWTSFLQQEALIFMGPEKIARSTNMPVYFLEIEKTGFAKYQFDIIPICLDPSQTKEYDITERHVRQLEQMILNNPEHWLWSHRRWKHKR